QTGADLVVQGTRGRVRREVGLVGEDLVLARVALTAHGHQVGGRIVGRRVGDAGDDGVARRPVVARLIAQRHARKVVLDAKHDVVLADAVIVVVRAAVVGGLVDRRGGEGGRRGQLADRGGRRRKPVVGEVVLAQYLSRQA